MLYDVPALITLSENKTVYNAGDCIVVRAQNLNENELLEFNTTLGTGPLQFFGSDGDTYALLPISMNNESGDYTLHIKAGGEDAQEKTIQVKALEPSFTPLTVSMEEYENMLKPKILEDIGTRLREIASEAGEATYFTLGAKFVSPVKGKVQRAYGTKVNFANASISGDSGMHEVIGTVYSAKEGEAVKAAQRGKVLFAGDLPVTGNTVVIDHGYGILSYYFHLKESKAVAGSDVAQSEIIGSVGQSGFTAGGNIMHYAVSVGGVFVNPQQFEGTLAIPSEPTA